MQVNFIDLIEKAHSLNDGIFTNTQFNFLNDYNTNYESVDMNLSVLYGSRIFHIYGNDFEKTYINFTKMWDGYLKLNGYNWQRIYNAMITEYSPLENYDKKSEITTTYNGKEKNTNIESENSNISVDKNITDSTSNTQSIVGDNTIVESGEDSSINTNIVTISETNNVTKNNGKQKSENKLEKTTYNDSTFFDVDKNTTNSDAFTDSEIVENNSNNNTTSNSKSNRSNTSTSNSSENLSNTLESEHNEDNSITNSSNKNLENVKTFENRNDVVVEHTHGNIGVTTSTKMLEDEYLLRQKLDFYMNLFTKFIYTYSY